MLGDQMKEGFIKNEDDFVEYFRWDLGELHGKHVDDGFFNWSLNAVGTLMIGFGNLINKSMDVVFTPTPQNLKNVLDGSVNNMYNKLSSEESKQLKKAVENIKKQIDAKQIVKVSQLSDAIDLALDIKIK